MSLVVSNLLDPSVTKWFPDFSDLVRAGSYLNWHILSFVEPWGPSTFVHVGKDTETVGIEKFGDSCDM